MARTEARSRPLPWGRVGWLDLALAGLLVVAAVTSTLLDPAAAHPFAEIVAVVVAGSVALRTVAPLLMAGIAAAGVVVLAFLPDPSTPLWAFATSLIVAFSIAAHLSGIRAVVGLVVLLAAEYVIQSRTSTSSIEIAFTPLILVSAPALAGWLLARSRAQARRLAELSAELERSRFRVAELSAEAERARIVRELHDVLGHTLSSIAVQAGAAGELLPPDALAAEPVRQIRRAAREGLDEVRAVLAAQDGAGDTRSGLESLPSLVAGSGAVLTIIGPTRPVAEPVSRAGFRIVQEALTNARRHAPGVAVRVDLAYADDGLRLDIVNDAPLVAERRHTGREHRGRGLLGMRERALACGGSATAGPDTQSGGWRVQARLPYAPVRAS